MSTTRTNEASLIEAAQAGDRQAMADLVSEYLPLVYNIVHRALADIDDVDDVVQETMLRAVRELAGLDIPENYCSWLLGIAVDEIGRFRHRVEVESRRTDPLEKAADRPAPGFEDLSVLRLGLGEQQRQLGRVSRWLDSDDQALLSLWAMETVGNITRTELAVASGLTVAHAGVRVQRMRTQLELSRTVVTALDARPRCAGLCSALSGWNGVPAPLWRKRIARHIRSCRRCRGTAKGLVPIDRLLAGLAMLPVPLALGATVLSKLAGAPLALPAAASVAAGVAASSAGVTAGAAASGVSGLAGLSGVSGVVGGAAATAASGVAAVASVVIARAGALLASAGPVLAVARPLVDRIRPLVAWARPLVETVGDALASAVTVVVSAVTSAFGAITRGAKSGIPAKVVSGLLAHPVVAIVMAVTVAGGTAAFTTVLPGGSGGSRSGSSGSAHRPLGQDAAIVPSESEPAASPASPSGPENPAGSESPAGPPSASTEPSVEPSSASSASARPSAASSAAAGSLPYGRLSLEAVGKPGSFVGYVGDLGSLVPVGPATAKDARQWGTFEAVRGLANPKCFSLKAKDGRYVRHQMWRLRLSSDDGSSLFRGDATFCPATGSAAGSVVLESADYPGWFLHRVGDALMVDRSDGSAGFKASGSFWVRAGLSS